MAADASLDINLAFPGTIEAVKALSAIVYGQNDEANCDPGWSEKPCIVKVDFFGSDDSGPYEDWP